MQAYKHEQKRAIHFSSTSNRDLTAYIFQQFPLPLGIITSGWLTAAEERTYPFGYFRQWNTDLAALYGGHEVEHLHLENDIIYDPPVSDEGDFVRVQAYGMPCYVQTSTGYFVLAPGKYQPYRFGWYPSGSNIYDAEIEVGIGFIRGHWKIPYSYTTIPEGRYYEHECDIHLLPDGTATAQSWHRYRVVVYDSVSQWSYLPLAFYTPFGGEIRYETVSFPSSEDIWRAYRPIAIASGMHADLTVAKYWACRKAVNDLDFIGVNWIENLASLGTLNPRLLISGAEKWIPAIENAVKNGIVDKGKLFADIYLSKKYGLDNDVRDANALFSGLPKLLESVQSSELCMRGGYREGDLDLRANVYCNPFDSGFYWTKVLGIAPTAANIWAAIPFSFAVDWVLGAGQNLEEIEFSGMWGSNVWHVNGICYTARQSTRIYPPLFHGWVPQAPQATVKYFCRWYEDILPEYLYEKPPQGLGALKNHVFEITSLALNAF